MASASNGGQIRTDCVDTMPDNSTFDLDQGLADTALFRNDLWLYEHLEVPECNDPPSPTTVDSSRTSPTDLFQISGNEEWVSANDVPMQLLKQAEQERADLLVVHPKAKVEGNCIASTDYVFVVKRFLFDLTIHGIVGVRHPEAYARLLRRLSRELRSWLFDSNSLLDPADYAGCLDEMRKDMEETWERLERDGEILKTLDEMWGPDGYVYVRRGTDTYVHCLLAAATELNSSSS